MADGNAALRDVASSRRHCNSQRCSSRGCNSCGCKLATTLLRWQVELTNCSAAMAGQIDKYAALQRWRLALPKFLFFFNFLLGNFNTREKKNEKLLYVQKRKRKRKLEKERKKEL
jgi:hypothetical protein